MKKILLLLALFVVAFTTTAQIEPGLRSGFTAGGSLNFMTEIGEGKPLVAWKFGYDMEYNLSEKFYLGSGILSTTKGAHIDGFQVPLRYYYVQVPLNIGGRIPLVENTYLFGQLGAYAAYAIFTTKYNVFGYGQISGEKFDWGFDAKIGVEFKFCQIHLGYDLGMSKVWKYSLSENVKHRSINLGLTFMF